MERGRPASADGQTPRSGKFERPCKNNPKTAPPSRRPSRKAQRPTSIKKIMKVVDKFDRPCYPEPDKSRIVYDYGPDLQRIRAAAERRKAADRFEMLSKAKALPKTSPTPPFKRYGSPFSQTCPKSGRQCSPNLTILKHVSAGSEYVPDKKRSPLWKNSSEALQKFLGGSNLVSRRMQVMTACAASSRAPMPESKARKLVFYKRWDKESFVEELEILKVALADQAYHFGLHRVHIQELRKKQIRLEEKVAAIESIDGSEAPRTGGVSRLCSKILGMQMKITNLENYITKYNETIQDLKYRYQVCLTREAYIERDLNAGETQRVQKEYRVLSHLHKELTSQNKKFLLIRDRILPELKAWAKQKQDNIKEIKQKIQENVEQARTFSNESYTHKKNAAYATSRVGGLEAEARSLRAKLKYERESKRATQQKVWALAYDTTLARKDREMKAKLKKAQDMDDMVHW